MTIIGDGGVVMAGLLPMALVLMLWVFMIMVAGVITAIGAVLVIGGGGDDGGGGDAVVAVIDGVVFVGVGGVGVGVVVVVIDVVFGVAGGGGGNTGGGGGADRRVSTTSSARSDCGPAACTWTERGWTSKGPRSTPSRFDLRSLW